MHLASRLLLLLLLSSSRDAFWQQVVTLQCLLPFSLFFLVVVEIQIVPAGCRICFMSTGVHESFFEGELFPAASS